MPIWELPSPEKEIRQCTTSSAKTALILQLQLIKSLDDPSLRIPNLLQFVSSHTEVLNNEECQKFFFSVLFHVSLDGTIPLVEYLKKNPEGLQLLADFVVRACKKSESSLDVLCFLFHIGVSCSEYAQKFLEKTLP